MEKMGFAKQFINSSFIINNGFLSSPVYLQSGLRQCYPLSLLLYVIQGEVMTNIDLDNNIKGIIIPNKRKEIKISQYADDSNFLLKVGFHGGITWYSVRLKTWDRFSVYINLINYVCSNGNNSYSKIQITFLKIFYKSATHAVRWSNY